MIKYNKHILFSYKNRYNTSINNSIFKITARKFEVNNTKLPYLFTKKIRKILLNLILQDLKNQRSFVYLKSHKYSFLNITQDLSTTLLPIESVLSNNFNYLTVFVKPSKLYFVLKVLKLQTSFQFSVLNFITSIDYPLQNKRFTLVYNLLSIRLINRITVKTCVDELTPLNSVYYLFPCSTWWEREVWDMFGIFFFKK
jgi:NADH:ubiquinone oxidoreductase subunit C